MTDDPTEQTCSREEMLALLADRDFVDAQRRQAQATLTEIRAVLNTVAVYEGMDASPLVMMVSELARDHEELERRIDEAMLEIRAVVGDRAPYDDTLAAFERIAEILRGAGGVPDSPEDL